MSDPMRRVDPRENLGIGHEVGCGVLIGAMRFVKDSFHPRAAVLGFHQGFRYRRRSETLGLDEHARCGLLRVLYDDVRAGPAGSGTHGHGRATVGGAGKADIGTAISSISPMRA